MSEDRYVPDPTICQENLDVFLKELGGGTTFLDYYRENWDTWPADIMAILASIAFEREEEGSTPKNLTYLLNDGIPALIDYCGIDSLDTLKKHSDMYPLDTIMSGYIGSV
ncbi:hypothetical protein LCGC14_0195310 [marine sediment metagenome]|uniref:Uncharacterized protein n=1 Tax=marine sediment metagenome TaxID=412755 RepID=A0A0F9XNB8_9ZZZZ